MAAATSGLALTEGDATARASASGELSPIALAALPQPLALARDARRTLRRILGFAFGYNVIGVTLAATAHLNPSAAAILMFASSATVIALSSQRRHLPRDERALGLPNDSQIPGLGPFVASQLGKRGPALAIPDPT